MSERTTYEHGVPCWVEAIGPDPHAAAAFYGPLLGWELDGPGHYLVARRRGRDVAGVGAPLGGGDVPPAWVTHVRVADAEATAAAARHAGGRVLAGPLDADPAGRFAVLADPAGAPFAVWEPRAREGAQLVNEPGAWAMSRLDTPDPEGAAAFYGALFGWTTEAFAVPGAEVWMLRLPGYVGGEPEQPVSRETVAAMARVPEGPARWSVDFWVDDVDAAVTAAGARGGTVLAPAAASPVGRTAVLADPHGADFSVSRVIPPAGS
jgi:predicted enzyme related to lactoylglutathione lyase